MTNKQSIADTAIEELRIKLKTERSMERSLKSLFLKISDTHESTLRRTRRTANFLEYNDDMRNIIAKNQRSVAKRFRNRLRKKYNLGVVEEENILFAINQHIDSQSFQQSIRIINTTAKEAERSLVRATERALEAGRTPRIRQLIKESARDFRRTNRMRSVRIAQTEIQNAAEQAKFTEAKALNDANIIKLKKRWNAILDQRVRDDHAAADGQLRELNEPFDVGGAQLMYPGDTSLGAPLEQTINCRCSWIEA